MMHIALIWDPYKHLEHNQQAGYEEEKISELKGAIEEFRNFESTEDGQTGLIDQIFSTESRLKTDDFIKKMCSKEL